MQLVLMKWARVTMVIIAGVAALRPAPPQTPPNVLVVTLDTVRADHIGCYGGHAKTPTLDALARGGILFEHAYTAVPLTLPSHAAILTGTYPIYNGVRSQPGFRLADSIPTLAEQFSAAAYDTGAVMGSSILDRRFGLARGFGFYDDHIANVKEEEYAGLPAAKRYADEVVDLGERWLTNERQQSRPFFLWLHLYDAHLPYRIPRAERARFTATYDGEIGYIDSALGRLFGELRERGIYDPTIIAVVADHGEGLGDHGESTHGLFLYNSTIRVPLIIKPAGERRSQGDTEDTEKTRGTSTRIAETVSTVDIAPTLLRMAGLPVPGSMQGTARMAAVTGQGQDPVVPVYAETFFPLLSMGWNPLRALITQDHKVIQAPHSELYDLEHDPGELHNLIGTQRALADGMIAELGDFVRQRTPAQAAQSRMAVSAETAQLFASLGYVGGATSAEPVFTTDRPDPKDRAREAEQILDAIHAYERQDLPTAERIFKGILRSDPDQPLALDTLGSTEFKLHDLKAAQVTYAHLLKVAPYYSNAYAELAHTDAMLGNRAEAEKLYQQAFAADPSNSRALRELGVLLVDDGKLPEARKILERSLQLQPGDFYALNALAQINAQQGDFGAAATALEQAIAADPKLIPPRLNLGFVYLRLNRPENTARLMEETTRLAPHNAQAFAELAVARLQLGDRSGAALATEVALRLDPQNSMAREAQRALAGDGQAR